MTCPGSLSDSSLTERARTDHGAQLWLIRIAGLVDSVVEDEVEEDVVAAEDARDLALALEVDHEALVLESFP
jgi:hypothetical protein